MGFTGYIEPSMTVVKSPSQLRKKSLDFLDQTLKHLKDKTIWTEVIEGYATSNILKVAKKINADLIVIGLRSLRCLEYILVGSVTEKELLDSGIPLFILPIKKNSLKIQIPKLHIIQG